jgi:hypothetical protein
VTLLKLVSDDPRSGAFGESQCYDFSISDNISMIATRGITQLDLREETRVK